MFRATWHGNMALENQQFVSKALNQNPRGEVLIGVYLPPTTMNKGSLMFAVCFLFGGVICEEMMVDSPGDVFTMVFQPCQAPSHLL